MKKHLVIMLILTLILALLGIGVWYSIQQRNAKTLYKLSTEFVLSEDSNTLLDNISSAESLYNKQATITESRLTSLHTIISKIDTFEQDLTSYLALSNIKASSTKNLNKSYKSLSAARDTLISNYNEYIARMSGNTLIEGNAADNLHNEIFNKTVNYVARYNSCFHSTATYIFNKVYKVDTIKSELYDLYYRGVKSLLGNISNNQFTNLGMIEKLNTGITLVNNNIYLKPSVKGGEFNVMALNFKKHYNNSDLGKLIKNFETYYNSSIDINTETSNEKLAIYYAKQILET